MQVRSCTHAGHAAWRPKPVALLAPRHAVWARQRCVSIRRTILRVSQTEIENGEAWHRYLRPAMSAAIRGGKRTLVHEGASAVDPSEDGQVILTISNLPAADASKSDEYSEEMNAKMGSTLTYRHENGMNFARIMDDLIVGSCLQTPEDLDRLVDEEGVGTVLCLQQGAPSAASGARFDMAYFDLDIAPIVARAAERGDVDHIRHEIRDFDPFSLRVQLPDVVRTVHQQYADGKGTVYIHCTAGMGRAPAVALAYMFWARGFQLQAAYEQLYAVRPCNPKLGAIREATCDLLYGADPQPVSISVRGEHPDSAIQVSGLDIGWGNKELLKYDAAERVHSIERKLLPGRYAYKLIFDGRWSYSADHPTLQDGDNTNNYVQPPRSVSHAAQCARLMRDNALLGEEQRAAIVEKLNA